MSLIEGWLDAATRLEEQAELCRKEGARLARKSPTRAGTALLAVEHLKQAANYLRQLADTEPTNPNGRVPGPPPIPTR